jgi:hypothetical protein
MDYALVVLLVAVAVVAVASLAIVGFRRALRTYLKFRGKMIVLCPETHLPAAVRVAAAKVGLEAALGQAQLELNDCSRWPERQACGQECLAQIEGAPKACLVKTIIDRWYQGQECVYCHQPFGEIHWHDHPAALLDNKRKTIQWNEILAENLQEALGTYRPVCWNCHIVETFRREHPERVVDRSSQSRRMSLYH